MMRNFAFPIQLRACLFALLELSSRLLYSLRYVVGCACAVSIGIDIRCTHCRRLAPPVRWLLVICVYSPSISYASSPPANDVHICKVLDYEDIRARDSLYAATKQALNLNVGEPRTVRMIYFLPNDRPFQQEVVDRMKVTIRQIQTFYADQMEANGYGRKTFRFETDAQGDPVVHRVNGQHANSYYLYYIDNISTVFDEIQRAFDISENIYFIVIDTEQPMGGVGNRWGKNGGFALVDGYNGGYNWKLVAHEFGHALGLLHDFRDGAYIMSYGTFGPGLVWDRLSACTAEFLTVHPYFNPDIPIEKTSPPTIELISPRTYPIDSKSVPVRLKVSDSDGVHQVIFSIHREKNRSTVKACQGLDGAKDAVVQFDYDGVIPSAHDLSYGRSTSLLDPLVHKILIEVVDTRGNTSSQLFRLFSDTLQPLTKISGDNQHSLPNKPLPVPFAVEVRDLNDGSVLQGVWVTFTVTAGGGDLRVERVETDDNGRAESTLTLGPDLEVNTVVVSADGIRETVIFNAVAGGEVSIPDPHLRAAIEAALNKAPGDPIAPAEMDTLTLLEKPVSNIRDLTGLEFATQLKVLFIHENPVSNLSPLAGLTKLESLSLSVADGDLSPLAGLTYLKWLGLYDSPISDVSLLAGLTYLEGLQISGTSISDISPLAGLTYLFELRLDHNHISDISALAKLTNLKLLHLTGNRISDVSPLAGLTNLRKLWLLNNTSISDVSPLAELTNLQELLLSNVSISDISPLAGLTNLRTLELDSNRISDLSPLAGLTNLRKLVLNSNHISDISALAGLTNLGWLDLNNNHISDISALAGLTYLFKLRLDHNHISDISALAGLTYLFELRLNHNHISDISALAKLTNLEFLHLTGNRISDISALVINTGLDDGDIIDMTQNPLDDASIKHIIALNDRGVDVRFDQALQVRVVDPIAPPIYWTSEGGTSVGTIHRVTLDGSSIQDLIRGFINDIALSINEGKIYYIVRIVGGNQIRRANLDGSQVEDLVTGLPFSKGLVLDVSGGKMYWAVNGAQKIQRANLDGSQVEDLVTGLGHPQDIALDVSGGKIYWTAPPIIQRANLDGTNVENICEASYGTGFDIVLDISGGKIYWTEIIGHSGDRRIQRANLDGSQIEDLVTGLGYPDGLAVDFSEDKIYWTDRERGKIQRANLDGTNIEDIVTGTKKPTGIALGISFHPGTVTEVPTPNPDFNGDGIVSFADFLQFVEQFGFSREDEAYQARFDLNGDGMIGFGDFLIFANNFGKKVS